MYICVCNAVTDREVRGAVALGVRSFADLKSTLGVGSCCGRCEEFATRLVNEARGEVLENAGSDG